MKKSSVIIALFLVSFSHLFAQSLSNSLPNGATVTPYKLEIGYNFNTAIAFPGTIKDAYWGYKEINAQTVPQVQNVLLVKAAKENFSPTNLHVFTADGRVYSFNVFYSENPPQTTFDLRKINVAGDSAILGAVPFSNQSIYENELNDLMFKARTAKPFLRKHTAQFEMQLKLKSIFFYKDILLFSFSLTNTSNLDYNVDFTRLYIKDKKKTKHTSFQEREIVPVKEDSVQVVPGQSSVNFVLAVPKFTIPDNKEFYFEVFESNGGRNLSLRIKNRHLLKAKPY
jgi:conjugative transposon TraN protein